MYFSLNSRAQLDKLIREIRDKWTFACVTDKIDECLILLKHALDLDLHELAYLPLKVLASRSEKTECGQSSITLSSFIFISRAHVCVCVRAHTHIPHTVLIKIFQVSPHSEVVHWRSLLRPELEEKLRKVQVWDNMVRWQRI
jgi:hypothetical protein